MNGRDPLAVLPLTHLAYHILLAIADDARHGYGIIKEVLERTDGEMELETGTLYAAIKRLRDGGLLEVVPRAERPADEDSRRRNYRLTAFGREVLSAESQRLAKLLGVAAEKRVLPIAPA